MRKTKLLGAEYCFGGSNKFYSKIEFKAICKRELWKKSGSNYTDMKIKY